jgi:hypothetical protein
MLIGKGEAHTIKNINRHDGNVRVTKPLARQHQPSQADFMDQSQLLPSNHQLTAMPQIPSHNQPEEQLPQHQTPNFDQMYQHNAGTTVDSQMFEPMAANDGGTMFGAW